MPGGDRTGPLGAGPKTGRGFGYCSGYDLPGYIVPAFASARGQRRGQGSGFGWRHRFFGTGRYALPTQEETLQALKSEADWLKGQLEAINKRIEELEK